MLRAYRLIFKEIEEVGRNCRQVSEAESGERGENRENAARGESGVIGNLGLKQFCSIPGRFFHAENRKNNGLPEI